MFYVAAFWILIIFCVVNGEQLLKIDLYVNGDAYKIATGSYPCYRQPAIMAGSIDNMVILAFAEGRDIPLSQCAPALQRRFQPNEEGGLVLRRSIDAGVTFAKPVVIYSGNMDFYTVVFDRSTLTAWLMLQVQKSTMVFQSTDSGLTWSFPLIFKVLYPPGVNLSIISPAVGHGIQIANDLCVDRKGCQNNGRFLLPFVCSSSTYQDSISTAKNLRIIDLLSNDLQCLQCHACLLWSDDHGYTWTLGAAAQVRKLL